MINIKNHGKYNILVITALYTYQQLYAQHSLMGLAEYDGKYQAMLELERALMEIEPDAVNEIKARFAQ